MYHHPSRRGLTHEIAERRARRMKLDRMARDRAARNLPQLERRSPFGPLSKASRQYSVPTPRVPADNLARFPRQRTTDSEGGRDA
ncbi:hypothetical protein [Streptomyces pseudogriseolus]|uniref:hypothetical protein n=2 Tax=Streptomyces pseudogriseolus TaxID=36817 RepID=UPI003FA33A9C